MGADHSSSSGPIEVKLDGCIVELPIERSSFSAIRSYLESLALQQQRILCALHVDGEPVNLTQPRSPSQSFSIIEGETMSLNDVPAQLIRGALQQTDTARARLQSVVELVLINNPQIARELWWSLSTALKEPLLTLSLLPDTICGPEHSGASLTQLRKWQLQQLGCVIQDVDDACSMGDTTLLSEVLEKRVLPWLDKLFESLSLWHETLLSKPGVAFQKA